MKKFNAIMLGLAIGLIITTSVLLSLVSQTNNLIQTEYPNFAKSNTLINKQDSTLIVSSTHPDGMILDDPNSEYHQSLLIPKHPGSYPVCLVSIDIPSSSAYNPSIWNYFRYESCKIKVVTLRDADVSSLVETGINNITAQCNVAYQNITLVLITQIATSALLACLSLAGLKDRED